MTIKFTPKQETKERYRLAEVPMPDSPDLREGFKNVLHISVTYNKRGFSGQGRGFYLSATGCGTDGTMQFHDLMNDPSVYKLIAPAKRFSAKVLERLVDDVSVDHMELVERMVGNADHYYARKGRTPR
jgi:hypothetical protein